MNPTINLNVNTFDLLRHLARATLEAQLDSCGLRHLACATNREALLDSCGLRHLARATKREAQLDSFELRHLAHATKREALHDSCWFGERLFGSSASKSIRMVGSWVGSLLGLRLGSFVGSLISCCNQIKWLTRTWFPATELRLVNAFEWLVERLSDNSTKNFKRAGIAFNPLLIIAFQKIFLNAVSFCFACVT